MRRRFLVMTFGVAAALTGVWACTLTQSLDYLQQGEGVADALPEAETGPILEAGTDVIDGGPASGPTVLVANQTKPGFLAQDATSLYWIAVGNVFAVPKQGGMPKLLGVVGEAHLMAADPDPNGAVFVAVGTDVIRLPKDGSGARTIVKGVDGGPLADTVAADALALYLLQIDENTFDSQIVRMAKDGGSPVVITSALPQTLTIDDTSVVWFDTNTIGNQAFRVVSKGDAPGSAGTLFPVGANDDVPYLSEQITIDSTTFYWSTDGTLGVPSILSRKREPAAPVIALYRGKADDTFGPITNDATDIYVVDIKGGAVIRVPKSGGSPKRVLENLSVPSGLAVDGTNIYVTVEATANNGTLLRIPK